MHRFQPPRRVFLGAAATAGASLALPARAQAGFPRGPIRLIVPVTPGGSADIVARALAMEMEASLKHPVVVENRPGGQFLIALQALQSAPADGHTLLYFFNSVLAIQAGAKLFDLENSIVPVARVATTPFALTARVESRFTSFENCIAYARANPGKVTYVTLGPASAEHLLMNLIMRETGVRFNPVAYKGGPDAVKDLLAGEVDLSPAVGVFFGKIYRDKLRPLALFDPVRWSEMPGIPTLQDLGLKVPPVVTWGGIAVRAGTPPEIAQRLYREVTSAASRPSIAEKLAATANYPSTSPSMEAFQQQVWSELAVYASAAKLVEPEK